MKAFTGGGIQTEAREDAPRAGQPAISLPGPPPRPAGKAASASELCPALRRPLQTFPAVVVPCPLLTQWEHTYPNLSRVL